MFVSTYHMAIAQWCVPNTVIPYNANMPGITHFVLNNIDRTSTDLENYPNNSYVNTGLSTELMTGQTYSVSITFTIDPQICPDMNLRVWIDYNHDYQLDDVGETVISVNNQLPGTYTGSFTVPSNVTLGSTRMRVTAKMSPNGGHTMPTPCDIPADPFGYHGEMEDYEVILNSPTGIENPSFNNSFLSYLSNDKLIFSFTTQVKSNTEISLYDISGKLIKKVIDEMEIAPGTYKFDINPSELKMEKGVYIAVLISNNEKQVVRIVYP